MTRPLPCTSTSLLAPSPRVWTTTTRRLLSTTPPARSALFNLGGLAASREGQYLSKETGIPRTEYSSNIHLIRSSEVDPFAPAPGASKPASTTNVPPRPQKRQEQQQQRQQQQKQQQRPTPSEVICSLRQLQQRQRDAAKPITFDALVEEHKQNKEALRNLQMALQEVRESSRNTARWTMAMLFTLLFITAYRWGYDDELKRIMLQTNALLNKPGGVNHQGQGPPPSLLEAAASEAAPAATTPPPQGILAVETQRKPPNGGSVLQWLRSSFWASGGK